MQKKQLIILISLSILLGMSGCGRSSSSTTKITGVLMINTSPAAEKTVYLKNAIGGTSKPMLTDAQGRFTYNNVVPGNYQTYYISTSPNGSFYSGGHEMVFQPVTLNQNNQLNIEVKTDMPGVPEE